MQVVLKKIPSSNLAYQRTYEKGFRASIDKNVQFYLFSKNEDHRCVFIYFFSPKGDRYQIDGPRKLEEDSFEEYLKVLVPFFSSQENVPGKRRFFAILWHQTTILAPSGTTCYRLKIMK